jgi:hypothetical protein
MEYGGNLFFEKIVLKKMNNILCSLVDHRGREKNEI